VLVDEAYVDFADGDCLPLLRDCPNVIVSRTLSKGYALAGLRFGYALCAAPLVAQMMKVKDSYNCDAIATAAARAALLDQDHARAGWSRVRAERERLAGELARLGWKVVPSQANFLLAAVPGGDGGAVYRGLKEKGILVRHFDRPGLAHTVRITIGRPDENDALLGALRAP
jgi:histidinol-phosphate aminotransferase